MQAVIFATSGMNAEHSRMASGVQACWTSGLAWAFARWSPHSDTPANSASKQTKRTIRMGISPQVFEILIARTAKTAVQGAVDGL